MHCEYKEGLGMPEFIKAWRSMAVLALAIAAGLFLTQYGTASAATPALKATDIANAVLFNDGPAAGYLKTVDRTPVQLTPEIRTVQAGVKKAIEGDKTGFYTSQFARQMQSGDPLVVRSALSHLGRTVHTVLEQQYGAAKLDSTIKTLVKITNAKPRDTDKGRDLDSPVVTTAVAVVVLVLVLVTIVFVGPNPDPASAGTLINERLTQEITQALHA
jgi:hypothetical protein